MRTISKTTELSIAGAPRTFRLTKLDAFSGAKVMRLVLRYLPAGQGTPDRAAEVSQSSGAEELFDLIFAAVTDDELHFLMRAALEHTEVLLDAGYQPVMQQGEWSWDEISHDTAACMKLTWESLIWTLDDFFAGSGPASQPAPHPTSP